MAIINLFPYPNFPTTFSHEASWSAVRDHVGRDAVVVTDDGINTNYVESFFSRIQRAYVGVHRRFSPGIIAG
ncbi:hypothetical protein [Roseibium sp. RKSG952]|uniref:hypothetical protein n=1 Tax=Roseibium sp. RKSG952 TaxID=2529384 RepID=UPI0012BC99A4|nr:hypothetical protein [Roseibium sp. RKSG952]MTH97573.1 hypothetical protein [Roseibium sp. RKSG952]